MAFRIHRGIWQFAKPDGSYESKYKINDSGELVTTDPDGNEQGSLMSTIAESDTLATVTGRGASTTSALYINNASPTLYLQDTDNRSAMIHVNSNYFYLLNGTANNSTGWTQQANSRWLFQGNLNNNDITFGGSGDFSGTVTASGGNSSQWNTAYGWGNHASAGYAASSHNHSGVYLPIGGKAADSNLLDGIDSASFLRSDTNDSFTGLLTATASDWYIYGLGARGASAGAYGIGNRAADSYRQMTFHVPNLAAYAGSGTIPSFGWYSNGALQLMKLDSDSGNLWTKGTIEADGRIYADDGLHVRGNWVRVNGSTGLYFESYGGGWHMTDSTWIRSYNSKPIYVDQYVRADQGFEVSGHRVIGSDKNVNAYSKVQIGGFTIQQNAAGDLEFVF